MAATASPSSSPGGIPPLLFSKLFPLPSSNGAPAFGKNGLCFLDAESGAAFQLGDSSKSLNPPTSTFSLLPNSSNNNSNNNNAGSQQQDGKGKSSAAATTSNSNSTTTTTTMSTIDSMNEDGSSFFVSLTTDIVNNNNNNKSSSSASSPSSPTSNNNTNSSNKSYFPNCFLGKPTSTLQSATSSSTTSFSWNRTKLLESKAFALGQIISDRGDEYPLHLDLLIEDADDEDDKDKNESSSSSETFSSTSSSDSDSDSDDVKSNSSSSASSPLKNRKEILQSWLSPDGARICCMVECEVPKWSPLYERVVLASAASATTSPQSASQNIDPNADANAEESNDDIGVAATIQYLLFYDAFPCENAGNGWYLSAIVKLPSLFETSRRAAEQLKKSLMLLSSSSSSSSTGNNNQETTNANFPHFIADQKQNPSSASTVPSVSLIGGFITPNIFLFGWTGHCVNISFSEKNRFDVAARIYRYSPNTHRHSPATTPTTASSKSHHDTKIFSQSTIGDHDHDDNFVAASDSLRNIVQTAKFERIQKSMVSFARMASSSGEDDFVPEKVAATNASFGTASSSGLSNSTNPKMDTKKLLELLFPTSGSGSGSVTATNTMMNNTNHFSSSICWWNICSASAVTDSDASQVFILDLNDVKYLVIPQRTSSTSSSSASSSSVDVVAPIFLQMKVSNRDVLQERQLRLLMQHHLMNNNGVQNNNINTNSKKTVAGLGEELRLRQERQNLIASTLSELFYPHNNNSILSQTQPFFLRTARHATIPNPAFENGKSSSSSSNSNNNTSINQHRQQLLQSINKSFVVTAGVKQEGPATGIFAAIKNSTNNNNNNNNNNDQNNSNSNNTTRVTPIDTQTVQNRRIDRIFSSGNWLTTSPNNFSNYENENNNSNNSNQNNNVGADGESGSSLSGAGRLLSKFAFATVISNNVNTNPSSSTTPTTNQHQQIQAGPSYSLVWETIIHQQQLQQKQQNHNQDLSNNNNNITPFLTSPPTFSVKLHLYVSGKKPLFVSRENIVPHNNNLLNASNSSSSQLFTTTASGLPMTNRTDQVMNNNASGSGSGGGGNSSSSNSGSDCLADLCRNGPNRVVNVALLQENRVRISYLSTCPVAAPTTTNNNSGGDQNNNNNTISPTSSGGSPGSLNNNMISPTSSTGAGMTMNNNTSTQQQQSVPSFYVKLNVLDVYFTTNAIFSRGEETPVPLFSVQLPSSFGMVESYEKYLLLMNNSANDVVQSSAHHHQNSPGFSVVDNNNKSKTVNEQKSTTIFPGPMIYPPPPHLYSTGNFNWTSSTSCCSVGLLFDNQSLMVSQIPEKIPS